MFVAYVNTTKLVTFVAPGTHSMSEYPFLDPGTTTGITTADVPAVLANPTNYYVNSYNNIVQKNSLSVTTSKTSLVNDGVDFVDLTVKVLDANSNVVHSIWEDQNVSNTNPLLDIFFFSPVVGWSVGQNGTILKTLDGGITWTPQTSGVATTLNKVFFISLTVGWVVGSGGVILATVNGGTTWTPQTSGTVQNLFSVYFVDANTGWTVGAAAGGNPGTILATTNGGTLWTAQVSPVQCVLYDVVFTNANNGYTVGSRTNVSGSTFQYTTNGGVTWTEQLNTGVASTFASLSLQPGIIYAGIRRSTFLDVYSIIGGISGTITLIASVSGGGGSGFTKLSFGSPDTGWAIGGNNGIFYTNDGGHTWAAQTNPVAVGSGGVFALPGNTGAWISSTNGHILASKKIEYLIDGSGITKDGVLPIHYLTKQPAGKLVINLSTSQNFNYYTNVVNDDFTVNPSTPVTINVIDANVPPQPYISSGSSAVTSFQTAKFKLNSVVLAPAPAIATPVDLKNYLNLVYLADSTNKLIYEFDTSSNTFTGITYDTSATTEGPQQILIDPAGTYLYAFTGTHIVTFTRSTGAVFNTATTHGISGAFSSLVGLYYALDSAGTAINVISYSGNTVRVTVVDAVNLPSPLNSVLCNNRLYITNNSNVVSIFNTFTNLFETAVNLGAYTGSTGITSDGVNVYVGATRNSDGAAGFFTINTPVNTLSSFVPVTASGSYSIGYALFTNSRVVFRITGDQTLVSIISVDGSFYNVPTLGAYSCIAETNPNSNNLLYWLRLDIAAISFQYMDLTTTALSPSNISGNPVFLNGLLSNGDIDLTQNKNSDIGIILYDSVTKNRNRLTIANQNLVVTPI